MAIRARFDDVAAPSVSDICYATPNRQAAIEAIAREADLVGGAYDHALRVGAAIECVHAQSLVHDDLPCMDYDDLRRGRPALHRKPAEGPEWRPAIINPWLARLSRRQMGIERCTRFLRSPPSQYCSSLSLSSPNRPSELRG